MYNTSCFGHNPCGKHSTTLITSSDAKYCWLVHLHWFIVLCWRSQYTSDLHKVWSLDQTIGGTSTFVGTKLCSCSLIFCWSVGFWWNFNFCRNQTLLLLVHILDETCLLLFRVLECWTLVLIDGKTVCDQIIQVMQILFMWCHNLCWNCLLWLLG